MTNISFHDFLFRLYHWMKNDGLNPILSEYKESQWYRRSDIEKKQREKLNDLLNYVSKNVPYYCNCMRAKRYRIDNDFNFNEFKKLPFLTKDIIRKNFSDLKSDSVKDNSLVRNSTSGSTGKSLLFYNDKKSLLHRQAVVCRNSDWLCCRFTDRKVSIWGAPIDVKKYDTLRGRIHSHFTRNKLLSSYELSDEMMFRYAQIIQRFQPKLLISYPSHLVLFVEFLKKKSLQLPSIGAIITSGETLYSWQRKIIEDITQVKVSDRYGSREFGNIAHQCEMHADYHINPERFYLEIVDHDGQPVKTGSVGDIVVTDLDNYGFPFIRYKIGDIGSFSSNVCPCGRNLPAMSSIDGRSFDVIEGPNGNRLGGTFWTLVMRKTGGIDNFQIIQKAADVLQINIVRSSDFSSKSFDSTLNSIQEKLGQGIQLNVSYVPYIPPTKSGKRKFVVSNHGAA
ncbi:phenylacetate--CoA ligase family protein [Desulfoplanes sp.]